MRAVMSYLRRFIGWYRQAWGFCPECNSDAPALYKCTVCAGASKLEYPPTRETKNLRWQRFINTAALTCVLLLPLAACQTVPVDRPCGVIRDDLATVKATTPGGQQRLDVHHARGKAAGCW